MRVLRTLSGAIIVLAGASVAVLRFTDFGLCDEVLQERASADGRYSVRVIRTDDCGGALSTSSTYVELKRNRGGPFGERMILLDFDGNEVQAEWKGPSVLKLAYTVQQAERVRRRVFHWRDVSIEHESSVQHF